MHPISEILRNRLLQHLPVALDGIGTLRLEHTPCERIEQGRRLAPPSRTVVLDWGQFEAPTLSRLVADCYQLPAEGVASMIDEWRGACADENNGLWIEGVGAIFPSEGCFSADPALTEQLNSLVFGPVTLPQPRESRERNRGPMPAPRKKSPHSYRLPILVALIAAGALAYLIFYLLQHTSLLTP